MKITIDLPVTVRWDKDANIWVGFCPILEIVFSQGHTEEAALRNLKGSIEGYIMVAENHGYVLRLEKEEAQGEDKREETG